MCKSKFKSISWLLALGLITGQALFASYSQDPTACSGTGGSVGITIFACTDSTCTTKTAISGTGSVIAGEWVAYEATFGPQAGKCAYALGTGTATLTLPNGTTVSLAADSGTCATTGGPVACTLGSSATVGACIGCDGATAAQTGASGDFPINAVNGYQSALHIYHVASADFVKADGTAGACTPDGGVTGASCVIAAKTGIGGTGAISNDIAFTGSSPGPGPELNTPQANSAVGCSATLDKQVSCDGKLTSDATKTWYDVTGSSDDPTGILAKGCIAKVGDNVDVRFISKNTGGAAISCTLSDSPGDTPITLTPGQQAVSLGALNATSTVSIDPFACSLSGSQSGNDTGTLGSCTCTTAENVVVAGTGGSDTATYSCCGVKVDKQVSCNGGGFQDGTLVSANEDGTNGCSAINGQTVAIKYRFQNTGNTTLTCNGDSSVSPGTTLGLTDTYVAGGAACTVTADCNGTGICGGGHCIPFPTTGEGTLAGGLTSDFVSNNTVTTCNSTLNTEESLGNKASLDCTCNADTNVENNVAVSAFDIAQIQCTGTSTFTSQKTCVPPGKTCTVNADCPSPYTCTAGQCSNTTFVSDVKVTNTGTNQESCAITDQVLTAQVCGTLPSCASPLAGGTPVTMSPNPLIVTGSPVSCTPGVDCTVGDSTGALPAITATACNQACITCTPDGGTALDPQAVQAECPVGSCFSRTPGYWGTHPDVTGTLLPLTVCGQDLTTTTAALVGSATENLCESGQDAKHGKGNSFYTSPVQLQLIRQCTAAALNLKASGSGDLTAGTAACEGADPGIASTFNNCCVGSGSTCDSGASTTAIGVSSCITLLDAFNNQFEGTDFSAVGLTNSKANPAQCQVATGNGLTNCSSDSLGGSINCGTK